MKELLITLMFAASFPVFMLWETEHYELLACFFVATAIAFLAVRIRDRIRARRSAELFERGHRR